MNETKAEHRLGKKEDLIMKEFKLIMIENGTNNNLYSKLTGKTRKTIGYFDTLAEIKNHMENGKEYEIRRLREESKTYYRV